MWTPRLALSWMSGGHWVAGRGRVWGQAEVEGLVLVAAVAVRWHQTSRSALTRKTLKYLFVWSRSMPLLAPPGASVHPTTVAALSSFV